MLGLDIAQAIADLAMSTGGDVLKALGDLAKPGKMNR
jgi:hypothetical protein